MITKDLEAVLHRAVAEAKRRRHEFVTLEHVLFAMAIDDKTKKILLAVGVNGNFYQGLNSPSMVIAYTTTLCRTRETLQESWNKCLTACLQIHKDVLGCLGVVL